MGRNGKFRDRINAFMQGRYGADQLSRFLSIGGCVCIILALIFSKLQIVFLSNLLVTLTFASLIWSYVRMFSKNIYKRQAENQKFLQLRGKVTGWFSFQKDRYRQRKEFVFYQCPSCKAVARVPRGKGKIRITCRQCGYAFERKT